jgi:hypothetical protein
MQLKVIVEYFDSWNELEQYLNDTRELLTKYNINSNDEIFTDGTRFKVKVLLEL